MKDDLTLIEELALIGLAHAKASGLTPGELSKDFRPALAETKAKPLLEALQRLKESGLVEKLPPPPPQKAARWRIQEAGRRRVDEFLAGFPTSKRNWKQKVIHALAARHALHLAPRAAAALVERDALPAYFLALRLGEEFQPSTTPEALARRVAASALGLTNDQPETLWRAILQRATVANDPPDGTGKAFDRSARETATSSPPADREMLGLAFPEQVRRAARVTSNGWFGSHKIFIHRAWESWRTHTGSDANLAAFKARLLEAVRAGEVALTRADFTAELAPVDLQAAETRYGNEVFHFITFQQDERP